MTDIEKLKKEIVETEKILAESKENYERNPEQYSAKLLLMSTENHLADLLKKLDALIAQQGKE